ncbi:MAG TPA: hypothetical protein VFZ00_24225 [Solirubrobacter sp.]|nr:hypothetical protein [Solirubrobacter sp.]
MLVVHVLGHGRGVQHDPSHEVRHLLHAWDTVAEPVDEEPESRAWGLPRRGQRLTLVWAVLDLLITHESNGIRFTELDRQRLNRVRYCEPDHAIPEEATAA